MRLNGAQIIYFECLQAIHSMVSFTFEVHCRASFSLHAEEMESCMHVAHKKVGKYNMIKLGHKALGPRGNRLCPGSTAAVIRVDITLPPRSRLARRTPLRQSDNPRTCRARNRASVGPSSHSITGAQAARATHWETGGGGGGDRDPSVLNVRDRDAAAGLAMRSYTEHCQSIINTCPRSPARACKAECRLGRSGWECNVFSSALFKCVVHRYGWRDGRTRALAGGRSPELPPATRQAGRQAVHTCDDRGGIGGIQPLQPTNNRSPRRRAMICYHACQPRPE